MYNTGIKIIGKEMQWSDIGFDFKYLRIESGIHYCTRIRKSQSMIDRTFKKDLPANKYQLRDFNAIESASY